MAKTTPKHFLSEGFPINYDLSSHAPPLPTPRDFSLYSEILEIWHWSVRLFDGLELITALVKDLNVEESLSHDLNRFAEVLGTQLHKILGRPETDELRSSILLNIYRHITILYTNIFLRECAAYPALAGHTLERIKHTLLDDKDYRTAPVYYMLRALLHGTAALIQVPERTWFRVHCIHIAMTMSYEQWAQLDGTMAGYLLLETNHSSINHILGLHAFMGEYGLQPDVRSELAFRKIRQWFL